MAIRFYCPDCNAREDHDDAGNCQGCRMDAESENEKVDIAEARARPLRLYPTVKEEREYRRLKAKYGTK